MAKSVRSLLLHGVAWNFIEKVLLHGVSFFIGIVLARLLNPSDYGLIGMLTIFLSISSVFIEGGFAKALIQRKECKEIDFSTAFVSNIGMSFLIYIVLFFGAPLIADFYHEPILTDLTRVLALNIVLGSFNIVQRARLMSQVDFKSLAQINVISTVISGGVGIGMAYYGYGVWSLVGMAISSSIVLIVVFPFYSKWKPSLSFSTASFRSLFGFGSKLMFTGVVGVIVNNISALCIGRYYKSDQLGYYTRASHFSELISNTVFEVLGNVTFPVLSSLQDDRDHLVAVYRKSLFYTALIIFPLMVLCTLLAKSIVIVLLTEKWLSCVILMQWLFLTRMFTPISAINMNVLNAIGRSDLFMKLDFAKIPLDIIVLVITIPISVKALVIGSFINSFICFFINAYLPGRIFGYGCFRQLYDWRYILLSIIIMASAVWFFLSIINNVWLQLIGGGLIGLLVYICCCFAFKIIDVDLLMMLKNTRKRI